MKSFQILFVALFFCFGGVGFGQPEQPGGRVTWFDLSQTVFEGPYNASHGYLIPSMRQALDLTTAAETLVGGGADQILDQVPLFGHYVGVPGLDWLVWGLPYALIYSYAMATPPGGAWLHESYHQAVLMQHGITSHNGTYDFKYSYVTPVNQVSDADLSSLKKASNPDLVRLHASGLEAQMDLISRLSEQEFFSGVRPSVGLRLRQGVNLITFTAYLAIADRASLEKTIDERNRAEANDVSSRDFTGPDTTAWVYDLTHPDEPYSARGPHPYGSGINRYISPSRLTEQERSYLRTQAWLSLLSLVDTSYWLGEATRVDGSRYSLNLRYYPTSFGNTVNTNLFVDDQKGVRMILKYSHQTNDVGWFPGLGVRMIDWAWSFAGVNLRLSPEAQVWLQPQGQLFRTQVPQLGGLVGLKVDLPLQGYSAWVETQAKTPGWVAGNENLGAQVRFLTGVRAWF